MMETGPWHKERINQCIGNHYWTAQAYASAFIIFETILHHPHQPTCPGITFRSKDQTKSKAKPNTNTKTKKRPWPLTNKACRIWKKNGKLIMGSGKSIHNHTNIYLQNMCLFRPPSPSSPQKNGPNASKLGRRLCWPKASIIGVMFIFKTILQIWLKKVFR